MVGAGIDGDHRVSELVAPVAAEVLSSLQVECLSKLAPVKFGIYSNTDRIVGAIRTAHIRNRPVSANETIALYKICWRYRAQVSDWTFIARVMIAKALLEERLDLADVLDGKVYARAWRAPAPQRELEV
jgi:hypothetical protein